MLKNYQTRLNAMLPGHNARHMVDRFFDVPDGFLGVTANMVGLLLL